MRERSGIMIVELGPAPDCFGAGKPADWILEGLGMAATRCPVVRPWQGDILPPIRQVGGAIFSGAAAMVTDPEEWHLRASDWLQTAFEAQRPILGICYGHQLIAEVLGATIADNPEGQEVGQVEIQLSPHAADDVLFGEFSSPLPVYTHHRQSVYDLPRFSRVLASNQHDAVQAFRWRDYVWGTQFHPEFDAGIMRGYLVEQQATLVAQGVDVGGKLAALDGHADEAVQILRRFARLIR